MKVILSRKGFDSEFGGYASLILPDGTLQSLPIPCSNDRITYAEVESRYQNKKLIELMSDVKGKVKEHEWKPLDGTTRCHLDPDIDFWARKRDLDWKGCFGQIGTAQSVLENAKVGIDDLFLFLGWFQECEEINGSIKMKKGNGKHVMYGYLQIGEVIHTASEKIPEWLRRHPHVDDVRVSDEKNCIYIARETCKWNEKIPGYGVFKYDVELDLTKPGMSRSKWALPPDIFRGLSIKYHSDKSWKEEAPGEVYFQSAAIGQEFIIEENENVTKWAQSLVEKNSY